MAVAISTAPAAGAHDWLVSSNPAANSTITQAPGQVRLSFDDLVLTRPARPQVDITGPDGRHYENACAEASGRDVATTWTPGGPGRYSVRWRIVSADGHPVSGSLSFTYAGTRGNNTGRASGLSCPVDDASSSIGSSMPVYLAGGAVALTAVCLVVMLTRSRRH